MSLRDSIRNGDPQTALLVGLPLLWALGRYAELHLFGETPASDAVEVWQPAGAALLEGGVPYVTVLDNKPPLWLAEQALAVATGDYWLAMLLVMAAANAAIALAVRRLGTTLASRRVGTVAALVYVLAIPAWELAIISDATQATAFVLAAIVAQGPVIAGVLFALGILSSPWAIVGAPALLWLYPWRQARPTLAAGLAVGVVALGALLVAYGPESAGNAVLYSTGVGDAYWTSNPALRGRSLLYDPAGWLETQLGLARRYAVVVVPATVGLASLRARRHWTLGALAVPLAFQPHWEFILPVACVWGVMGLLALGGWPRYAPTTAAAPTASVADGGTKGDDV
jgi:hypothetical protein